LTVPHRLAYFNAGNKILCTTKHIAGEYLVFSGNAMNSFINENWRTVYSEAGKDVSMAVGQIVFSILKEALKTLPFKEMFNDVE
jgi:hypothetical protein